MLWLSTPKNSTVFCPAVSYLNLLLQTNGIFFFSIKFPLIWYPTWPILKILKNFKIFQDGGQNTNFACQNGAILLICWLWVCFLLFIMIIVFVAINFTCHRIFLLILRIFKVFPRWRPKKSNFAQQYDIIFLVCWLGAYYLSLTTGIIFVVIFSTSYIFLLY